MSQPTRTRAAAAAAACAIFASLGAALALASPAAARQAPAPKPVDPWAQARFEITERVRQELEAARWREIIGTTDAASDAALDARSGKLQTEFIERVLVPMIAAARSCEDLRAVAEQILLLERERQILGSGDGTYPIDEAEFSARLWAVCYEEAYRKCVADHDLGQIAVMLSMERTRALLGSDESAEDSRLQRCGTFEFQLETHLEMSMDVDAAIQAPLTLSGRSRVEDFSLFGSGGSAPLELIAAMHPEVDLGGGERMICRGSFQGLRGAVLDVKRIDGELKHAPLNERTGQATGPAVVHWLELDIDPGSAAGTITNTCTITARGAPPLSLPMPPVEVTWSDLFRMAHADEEVADGVIRIRFDRAKGEIPGGTLFARKTYVRAVPHPEGPGVIDERTEFNIWHRPAH